MAEHTVATAAAQRPSTTEHTRNQARYVAPPVDIYETPDGLVVVADMPGVTQEELDVRVENNMLTMRGQARHTFHGDRRHHEYDLVNFFRQFELHEQVDQQRISADLQGGVLTLHLPKAEAVKPRRIIVHAS